MSAQNASSPKPTLRTTGCGCLILTVIVLAVLILIGNGVGSPGTAKVVLIPTTDASVDAHGYPIGYTARLLSPMGMSSTQARCVDDYLEQTHSYATIQAVLLTDNGQKTLVSEVQAIIAAKCPA